MSSAPRSTTPAPPPTWDRIICVDWAKDHDGRAVWIATVSSATLAPLHIEPTVRSLVAYAAEQKGRTLIGIDAALGIPKPYLTAAKATLADWRHLETFPDWLILAARSRRFMDAVEASEEWSPGRPFIALSKAGGIGSLGAFWTKAGCDLRRAMDVETGGKSPFLVSGIPGTVGSGSRALWGELLELLTPRRAFGLMAFDGTRRLQRERVVLGEIYPRACYATALAESLPATLRPLGKAGAAVRASAIDELTSAAWRRRAGVNIDPVGIALARANQDHFDAMMSAAALLRCALDGQALEDPGSDPIEGGILGRAAVARAAPRTGSRRGRGRRGSNARVAGASASPPPGDSGAAQFRCPIEGCGRVFKAGRNGWDGHVGSPRTHPAWHPTATPGQRRARFRREFAAWLGALA